MIARLGCLLAILAALAGTGFWIGWRMGARRDRQRCHLGDER